MRSSTPPCPGSREPMSLSSRSRLIRDSARSPSVAVSTEASPSAMPISGLASNATTMPTAPTADASSNEPARPSQVFLGLTEGARRFRPRRTPAVYPPVSLAVASDTGGYTAGVLLGRNLLAPSVSPKKTWEGLAGSLLLASAVGAVGMVVAFDANPLIGIALGLASVLTATLGDLAESLIKRDLELKDMGSLLPGHGGVLDRIDSLLLTAPLVYLVLLVTVPGA